jgi:parvulin-like peptidyl-prolyl isomerase
VTRLRSLTAVLGVALVAALALTACGDDDAAVATVNGSEISESDLRDDLEVLREHPDFARALYGTEIPAEQGGALDRESSAAVLSRKILVELVEQEFDERDLEISSEDREAVESTFSPELEELLDQVPSDFADRFRTWQAQMWVLRDALGAEAADRPSEVTDDDLQDFWDEHQAVLSTEEQACARHVLLETESDAEEVLADLAGGADFGEVAAERSQDPSAEMNDGELGCTGPGVYVPEFEAAVWEGPVGELQGPVETQFGYHVILVDSRGTPTFEELADDIRIYLESPASREPQQLFEIRMRVLSHGADISVDSRFGTWNPETNQVEPASNAAQQDR